MASAALKLTRQAASAGVVGSLAYTTYLYRTDPGVERMVKAYGTLIPVVMHYRAVESWEKLSGSPADWDQLDAMYAVSTVQALGALQGMYCKYCQTAAGFTNTFGDAWIREFRRLESDVPPRPVETVYQTIESETGKPVEEIFSSFDPVPLGSASIGQVHKAILKDSGKVVAVKVQYPEAQDLFRSDMQSIRNFCQAFAPEQVIILAALEDQNASEVDYTNEAENLSQVRKNMVNAGFHPRDVVVPRALPEYTTPRMLVMEFIEGTKLVDGMRSYYSSWAKDNGTTLEALEKEARDRIENEGIPSKYEGPSATTVAWYRRYLRIHDAIVNTGVYMYNQTLGRYGGSAGFQKSLPPPNTARIVDTLMKVHGHQLLVDGCFTSDPNGGNFVLMPDGRIGLIDFGATKRLDRNERLSACLLYAALARGDETLLHNLCKVGGYKSKYGKKEVLMKLLQFGFDSYGKDVTGGKNIQQFIDELKRDDPWEELADNLVLAQVRTAKPLKFDAKLANTA